MTDYTPNSLCRELNCDHDFITAVVLARLRDLEFWCGVKRKDPNDARVRDEWLRSTGIATAAKLHSEKGTR